MSVDNKDRRIIAELVQNSDQTTSKLSKKLGIPITTVHNRIKKLQKDGVIINYTVNLDHHKLGRPIPAFINVTINYGAGKNISQTSIATKLKKIDGVYETYILTGGADIVAKVLAKDIPDLNAIVTEKLRNIEGIDKTQTSIVLKEV
ncbi:MAG: Lrp/AsnC family transcriptional regulator [Candidatus Woesearchaeota archaeon]|jgi:Lrp/AsnC family transcriptional regulator for asnA, asnC and gidA|nr:Lrp/AsnC family transcriptional regulator [Candidatus Woesearchaeota archaeon]MDP7198444.1 Lrp/AsnC family transcriptional regulator [Candidatus Woesearchaeota archaeon]MDP7466814.1 Lrp/AsnC family transcriptional regulator [Candidatus Woesearchaeota archaeon]MDP7648039.1 Lrp/AsnC family transcriptional regulator [Candidatus Woesearchaeota archaeon]